MTSKKRWVVHLFKKILLWDYLTLYGDKFWKVTEDRVSFSVPRMLPGVPWDTHRGPGRDRIQNIEGSSDGITEEKLSLSSVLPSQGPLPRLEFGLGYRDLLLSYGQKHGLTTENRTVRGDRVWVYLRFGIRGARLLVSSSSRRLTVWPRRLFLSYLPRRLVTLLKSTPTSFSSNRHPSDLRSPSSKRIR